MTDGRPGSLADALNHTNPATTGGRPCKVAATLNTLGPEDRDLFDQWADTRTTGSNPSIGHMARSITALTGTSMSTSGLGLHLRRACCCYGYTS